MLAASDAAKAKRLSVGVGLQRRHQPLYLEKVKQIHDGAMARSDCPHYFNMKAAGRAWSGRG